jgi:hypothetical protein
VGGHRPIDDDHALPAIAIANRVEYVGGSRDGESEDRDDLPDVIGGAEGQYLRSVRCTEDGAMRYVWHDRDTSNRRT